MCLCSFACTCSTGVNSCPATVCSAVSSITAKALNALAHRLMSFDFATLIAAPALLAVLREYEVLGDSGANEVNVLAGLVPPRA
jgi:hypothetical protein